MPEGSPVEALSGSTPERLTRPTQCRRAAFHQRFTFARLAGFALVLFALLFFAHPLPAIQLDQATDATALPDASSLPDAPGLESLPSGPTPQQDFCCQDTLAGDIGLASPAHVSCTTCRLTWYQRFANGPQQRPLTTRDKAWLASRNFIDPFNLIAVAGEAGIAVAADSHSPYGPGMPGFGRNVGVSLTEDLTGEFFGTFLIPSAVHQDPYYYRMEHAPIHRRIGHAFVQVVWTRGDNGKGMLNYADLAGFAVDNAIANLYVPGRETSVGATADRYAISLASAPVGNLVNEFLPDVASHVHVQIVIIQRIINQIAEREPGGSL